MKRDSDTKSKSERRPDGQGTPATSSSTLFALTPISKADDSAAFAGATSIAERLIVQELQLGALPQSEGRAAFSACEKLRQPLSNLIGMVGFCSLISRALTLAKGETPWLGGLQIGADGALGFSTEMTAGLDGDEAARGGTALIAQLLGLLVTFIGEALTLRLVYNVWPKAAATDSKLKGNAHEKNS